MQFHLYAENERRYAENTKGTKVFCGAVSADSIEQVPSVLGLQKELLRNKIDKLFDMETEILILEARLEAYENRPWFRRLFNIW